MKEVETLWEEVRELSLGNNSRIQRLDSPPTSLEFLREFVSQNKPCIINKANLHWPALSLWTQLSYLSKTLSSSLVSLHLTPNGRADSLVKHPSLDQLCFASAHVQQLPFDQALQLVLSNSNSTDSKVVAYLQQQNDCFRSEYSVLGSDCDEHIPWATEALGCYPEAVNLWIGNHLSETSFHKDHYENLYAVVSGQKHFLLLPPTDVHRMYIRQYPAAHYSYSQDMLECTLELEKPAIHVPWCSVNPYPSPETRETEMAKFPLFFNGPKPFQCTVNPGEILYLPSMWFHHVRQSPDENGVTVAVNYCKDKAPFCTLVKIYNIVTKYNYFLAGYDMQFDIKYAYFNFLQSIHYKSPHDPTLSEIECEDLGSDASVHKHNLRDADALALNDVDAKQDNEDE